MRKFLLFAVAFMMSVAMMAVGKGDGTSKANAIDFDWDGTYIHEANNTSWHCIKLSKLSEEADDPTVALYLTNLTNERANVELSGSAVLRFSYPISLFVKDIDLLQYAGDDATATYEIEGKKHVVWTMPTSYDLSSISDAKVRDALTQAFGDISNVSLLQLVEFGLNDVYLEVSSDKQIAIAANVYETAEIVDDACTKAVDFNWAGETVEAGETWFYLDLNAVKNSDKKLNFVVENNGAVKANVNFDLYADCPASAILLDYDWAIAAGSEVKEALGRFFLDQMTRDYVYLKLTTNQTITLKAKEEVLPPAVELFNPSAAPVLEVGKEYVLNGETVLKVDLAALKAPKGYKTVCHIVNANRVAVNLKQEIAFSTPVTSNNVQEKNLLVEAGAALEINVPNKQVESVKSNVAYFRLTTDESLTLWMEHVKLETSNPIDPSTPAILAPSCEDSYVFDWNSSIKQKALMTKWYELDIAPLKNNKEHVQLAFTNHTDAMVVVFGSVLLDCNSKDTIQFVCPVPAGTPINKVLDYSLLAASPLQKVYVSLTMVPTKVKDLSDLASIRSRDDVMDLVSLDFGAEIEVKAKRISALVDPTYCESTYQTLEKGKEYNLEAGVTKWYRVTDEFIKNDLGLMEQLTIFNQGQNAANVKFGVTLDCKYGIATTVDQTVPRWFDITTYYPTGLFRLVDAIVAEDITEFYLSVTSDQPMLFGFELDYGTMLGCDDAREFDWTKGAVIEKGDAQWLSFDVTSAKQNKQQVRLTLTNESNSLAWVAMLTSLTCPFDVALPMVFAIPTGMSIDKVVDYSYFAATKLDQLYVALITEETISVKAVAEKSQASASDYAACENAVEVKNGEAYVQKAGTTWYKFNRSLFSDVSRLPKFRYAAEATTSLTMGVTVGCEYNIATRGTIKLPTTKGLEVSFRMPGFIYDVLDKFVHDDVEAVYVEMTTDQQIKFGLDMEYAGGCEKATKLDLAQPLNVDLTADKDVWYAIDLKEVKALGDKKISFNLNNQSDKAVEVEFEVTPTCPLIVSAIKAVDVPAGMNMPLVFPASTITNLYDQVVAKFDVPDKIANNLPEQLTDDLIYYVRVRANGDLSITPDTVSPFVPEESCATAEPLDWTKTIELSALETGWYRLDISSLRASKTDFTLSLNNNTGSVKALTFYFYEGCSEDADELADMYLTSLKVTAPEGVTTEKVPYSAISYLLGDLNEFYVYLEIEGGELNEACLNAKLLADPNVPHTIQLVAGKEQWFKVATNELDKLTKNLKVSVDAEVSDVTVSVSSSCYVEPVVDTTVVLDKAYKKEAEVSKQIILDKWSKYSNKVSGIDTAYIRVLSTGNITLVTDTVTPTPPVDPSECEKATLLDWTKTVNLSTLTTGWYKFDISSLHSSQSNFQLSLNNDLNETKAVYMELYLNCKDPYVGKTTQVFPVGLTTRDVAYSLLTQAVGTSNEVYVYIKTDVEVPVIPESDACLNAIELTWNDTLDITAGDTTWYMLPLAEAKALGKDLELTVTNNSGVAADVYVAVSEQCPVVSYLAERTGSIPAGMTLSKTLANSELITLADTIYFRLSSTQDLTIVAAVAVEEPETPQGCEDAILLDWTKTVNLSELTTGWYKFDISSIHTANTNFTLSLNNDMGEKKNLGFKLYKDCNSGMLAETVQSFKVGITTYTVPEELIGMAAGIDMLYVYLTIDAKLPCEDATLFDWNKGAYQDANMTQWYEFDITPVLEQEKQVKLTFTNHSNENAWVIAELALSCPYTVSIPIIVPVPANMSVDKWVDYSVFEASKLHHCYLGVTTREAAIELSATWEDARITPSEGCLNATKVETGVLYEHSAGTHWYKFTGDLFAGEGKFSRIRVINRSANTLSLTAGATVGCEYNIATRSGLKLPKRFDMAFALPVWVVEQMKKFVDDDVKEFYLELTTDQDFAFSIGQDACESAIPFDWTTGHSQEALTTQWYDVNIAPVLANEQQIKLTLTNHSDQTAWVATLVSLDCPFKVALPLAFPIPAGMSVDKVVDYSYFAATKLDRLYVGVTTDNKISITAEAQSAQASADAKLGCQDATDLKVGETYVHPAGTSWYKVDGALFADMGRLPRFYLETVSGETTKLTMGATVGCEYNIATRGTVNVPGGVGFSLRIPSFIFKVMKQFINEDVHAFYVEMTTDKDVEFRMDQTTKEEFVACENATEFVFADSMTINLKANEDVWYTIDLATLKTWNKDMAFKVVNPSAAPVEVEVEVSPTCPVVASVTKKATVPASLNVTKVLTAEQIVQFVDKYPDLIYYVRVRATGDLHVDANEYTPIAEDNCQDAIEYVWGTDLDLQANEDAWYKLAIVDLREKGCDIQLTVQNKTTDTVQATLDLYDSCPVDLPIISMEGLEIAALTTRTENVSASYLPEDVDTVYLHIYPTGALTVNISSNCVPPPVVEEAYQTIADYVCDNSEYVSPVTNIAHLISSTDINSLTWSDTVHVSATLDSVYTFVITPIVAPVAMTDSILVAIYGTLPVFNQGEVAVVDTAMISEYYEANDTEFIADVVSVAWNASKVDCDATAHVMALEVIDACGNVMTTTHIFPVATREAGKIDTVRICDDEAPYIWLGNKYEATGLYQDTLQSMNGCDSVVTLDLVVWPATKYVAKDTTICYGDAYEWNGQICDTTGLYKYTIKNQLYCDSIVYTLNLTVLPEIEETITTITLPYGGSYTWNDSTYYMSGRYSDTLLTENHCDSIITLILTVEDFVVAYDTTAAFVCDGTAFVDPITGEQHIISSLMPSVNTWSNMVHVNAGLDSVYVFDITPVVAPELMTDSILEGIFGGMPKLTQGLIPELDVNAIKAYYDKRDNDTISDVVSVQWLPTTKVECGASTHVMTLVVEDACDNVLKTNHAFQVAGLTKADAQVVTLCRNEAPYLWNVNNKLYDDSGVYTDTLQSVLTGCDSVVVTLNLSFLSELRTVIDTTICYSELPYVWPEAQMIYWNSTSDSITDFKSVSGCDSVVVLNLTVLPEVPTSMDTVVACGSYFWNDSIYTTSGDHTYTTVASNGCDSVATLHLTINTPKTSEESIVACGSYFWNDSIYTTSGDHTYTTVASNGCDSVATLHLTVNPSYAVDTNAVATSSFEWYGQTYDTTGVYTYNGTTVAGCDSVVTLYLIIHELPKDPIRVEVMIVDTVCAGTEYQGRLSTVTVNKLETWTDSVRVEVAGVVTDSIYHYAIQPYVMTLPVITVDDIVAVCGKAVDVRLANTIFSEHVKNEPLYAPNAVMNCYILVGDTYTELTHDAIDGTQTEVTIKFTITTDCGTIESDPITVRVQTPSPENDEELGKVPAYNKYGGRLLTVDLGYIKDQFDFEPAEEDVTWYLLQEDADDIEQGKGYYLTTADGTPLDAGLYYARINYSGTADGDCDMILQTVILQVETLVGPKLAPTVAKPNDLIKLLNLDAHAISTVRMYSAAGELLDTFQVKDMKETSFRAAQTAGYYIVEVQTETEKVSLRYIVK